MQQADVDEIMQQLAQGSPKWSEQHIGHQAQLARRMEVRLARVLRGSRVLYAYGDIGDAEDPEVQACVFAENYVVRDSAQLDERGNLSWRGKAEILPWSLLTGATVHTSTPATDNNAELLDFTFHFGEDTNFRIQPPRKLAMESAQELLDWGLRHLSSPLAR